LKLTLTSSQTHARVLAQRIKTSTTYTTVVGDQLNIIGPEDSTDMNLEKSTLDTVTRSQLRLAQRVRFRGQRYWVRRGSTFVVGNSIII
jgi:hypothetical protein